MSLLNYIQVLLINAYATLASWHLDPANAIYTRGYGYDYSKTED